MTEDTPEITNEPKLPAKAFVAGALTQFALGLHAPFLQTYLVDMQNYLYGVKNFAELGAFRSDQYLEIWDRFCFPLLKSGEKPSIFHSS